ncbi:MAG: glycosyltransferase [Deltaproteobacteria bacterium]|nr:glycosyltransferase [Deltaproteobacteria bacterium]
MTDRPRISVVIPCYNMGAFVGEAVDSVLAQRLGEVEIVLVDDGSNDGETPEAIDALARRAPIRVVRTSNRGLAAARNEGVRTANGELIAFLDADDRFAPGALDAMDRASSAHPDAAYVYGHTRAFGARDEIWHRGDFNFFHLLYANEFEPAVMIRKEALDRVGGFRPVGPVPGVEDWDLWLRLGALGLFGRRIDAVTLEYRIRPGSMVAAIKARWTDTVAAIRDANFELFTPERLIDLRRRWSPGVSFVAPPERRNTERIPADFLDFEIVSPEAAARAAHVVEFAQWNENEIRNALDRVRANEQRWPTSRVPEFANTERAKRHASPIWWSASLPRDADDLDGPLARVRLFLRRLRHFGENPWTAYGAGLFAQRILDRLNADERPAEILDDRPGNDTLCGIPVRRPDAGAPPASRVLVLSDLYAGRIFERACAIWPTLAGRIHALDW